MNLTIQDLLHISRKAEIGISKLSPKLKIRDVSTDSRSIKKGDLFIALRGENFDGHEFIEAVGKQGAVAAIVDEKWYKSAAKKKQTIKLPLLVVKNTLDSYGELANTYRKKFSIPILLVAGSNGKTTMKEVISHVLGTSFNVLKTEANYNNHVGLPRMLLELRPKHAIAVLEIGTNHPGEIAWLTKVAAPTHGIITNIGREHLEFFKDIHGVAKEELALFDYLKKNNGIAFINCDDPIIKKEISKLLKYSRPYGKGTEVFGQNLGFTNVGKLKIKIWIGDKSIQFNSNLIADYTPSFFAGAANIAASFGMENTRIKKALASYKPYSKRMEIVKLSNGAIAINDTYNANPESFLAALETLKNIPAKGNKYVIAGDMLELGESSKREHHKLGVTMAKYNFDGYYFTGKAMEWAFQSFVRAYEEPISTHEPKDDIVADISKYLKRGDVILVKGSRGMKMETIVEQLRIKN